MRSISWTFAAASTAAEQEATGIRFGGRFDDVPVVGEEPMAKKQFCIFEKKLDFLFRYAIITVRTSLILIFEGKRLESSSI